MICSICQDTYKTKTTLNCSHSFCLKCIKKWSENKKSCPMCRAKFKKKHIYNNVEGIKTRSLTKYSRYKETNKIFNVLIDKINYFEKYSEQLINISNKKSYKNYINKNLNEKFKEDFETCINSFLKFIYDNRNLYECKYKSTVDNLCLEKKMCDYNMVALKCKNCLFKYNIKKYMNYQLKKYKYKNLSEWEFKLNDVGFF